jgi:hypothetical protein
MTLSCPICGPILERVAAARDFSTLAAIRRQDIPNAEGITNEQRQTLNLAVINKEDELGRYAVVL